MEALTNLGQYGVIGICLALIIVVAYAFKILVTHSERVLTAFERNAETQTNLATAVEKLSERIDRCPYNK